MTTRERNLLILLVVAVACAALVVGLGSYLDGITRLDAEYVSLQKRALRVRQAALEARPAAAVGPLKERFFVPGTLTDPLVLASRVQAALKSSGLQVLQSRVVESTASSQWIEFHAEGEITAWFRFLRALRQQDARTLFRSMSLLRKQTGGYAITFEVGHAVLP